MLRSRVVRTLLIVLLVAPLALLAAACSRPQEEQFLTQFFRAARARDNTTMSELGRLGASEPAIEAMMSAVEFSPRDQGTIEDFSIVGEPTEVATPVDLKSLVEARSAAQMESDAFTKEKLAYQNANLEMIETVIKIERSENPRWTAAQQTVKDAWDKWRADTSVHARAVSDARTALQDAVGPMAASLQQPGQPTFDPSQFEGSLITKEVTISAQVQSPEGEMAQKTLTIRMQRAEGTQAGEPRSGRWIIPAIDEA